VSWLAPADPNVGGVIDHYEIDLNGTDFNWNYQSTSLTISDLDPDTQYTITVRAVNNYHLVGPSATVTAWTQVETPYDADLGVIGDRPAVAVKPSEVDTGARQSTTRSMTGGQALDAALAAPVEADGKRYLRRVRITTGMKFNKVTHSGIVFEDCVIDTGESLYGINAFLFTGIEPPVWPEFRYCEITGGRSATIAGGYIRLLRCNVHRGTDTIKIFTGMEIYASYAHDTWYTPGAHCDLVQIEQGAANTLIHWSNFEAWNAMDSPAGGGGTSNAVLQTGSVNGDIGPVDWFDNWFDGGHYTIRGTTPDDPFACIYTFRRNKHGRGYQYGPLRAMTGRPDIDYDTSNVWADTGLPVLG